MLHMKMK